MDSTQDRCEEHETHEFFQGKIENIHVVTHALSAADVAQAYREACRLPEKSYDQILALDT